MGLKIEWACDIEAKRFSDKVTVTEEFIILNVQYEYIVPRYQCQTYEGILSWALHLSTKEWMDRCILREFMSQAISAAGLEYPRKR